MDTQIPSLGRIIGLYAAFYVGISLVLEAALWALATFANVEINSSALGWVPAIVGAMQAGQSYGRKVGTKPPGSYAWLASLGFLFTSIVLSLVITYVILAAVGYDPMAMLRAAADDLARENISQTIILAVLGGFALFLWIILRFSFSSGAGQGARMQAKLDAWRGT